MRALAFVSSSALSAPDEPDGEAGATVLAARALTEGTEKYDAIALVEASERLGASIHADAGWDALGPQEPNRLGSRTGGDRKHHARLGRALARNGERLDRGRRGCGGGGDRRGARRGPGRSNGCRGHWRRGDGRRDHRRVPDPALGTTFGRLLPAPTTREHVAGGAVAQADPRADRGDLDRRATAFAERLGCPTWESGTSSGRTQGCLVSRGSVASDKDRWPG